jgi:hypothetical protein
MKNLLKALCILLIVCTQLSFTVPNNEKADCSILHSGTFTYTDDDGEEVMVIIEGENHTEYHKNKKYVIESTIKWVNDCEFNATLKNVTLPKFPFAKGTVMNVKVDSVEGNFISYTGKVKGTTYKGTLRKKAAEGTNNR